MKFKKLVTGLLTSAMLITMLAACGGGSSSTPAPSKAPGASQAPTAESQAPSGEAYKVAMLLTGYINDAGWNQSAYEGIKLAEEEFGIESA